MAYFIFAGDMLVMGFMFVLVVWLFLKSDESAIERSARIPLEDEDRGDG